jgi:hypothetical protein
MSDLPEATAKPCNECPWRRASFPGHLGPFTPEEWVEIVHSDAPIACHKTITEIDEKGEGNWSHPQMRQCAGAGIHRTNTFKSPRDPAVFTSDEPDTETVFARSTEFIAHHRREEQE